MAAVNVNIRVAPDMLRAVDELVPRVARVAPRIARGAATVGRGTILRTALAAGLVVLAEEVVEAERRAAAGEAA